MGSTQKTPTMRQIQQILPVTPEEKAKMELPYIYQPVPDILQLQIGKEYDYCACGLSKKQPFCDGSHQGTKFKPIRFTATNKTNILCLCKRSKKGQVCDNAHKKFMNIDF